MIAKLSLFVALLFLTVLKFKIPEFELSIFIFCAIFAICIYFGYQIIFGLIRRIIESGADKTDK